MQTSPYNLVLTSNTGIQVFFFLEGGLQHKIGLTVNVSRIIGSISKIYQNFRLLLIYIFLLKSLLSLIPLTVIPCGEHWKTGSSSCLCLWLLWLVEMFSHKGNYLWKQFNYILFHKHAFHWLKVVCLRTTISTWGKHVVTDQVKMLQFLSGSLRKQTKLFAGQN